MKQITFIFAVLVPLLFSINYSNAQPTHEQQNLQKYWIYRERLKDYMITGTIQGCDIPSPKRAVGIQISWDDAPWQIGYWIGTLAMEYDLLSKAGYSTSSPELMRTKQDLFNAIEAVNRIDCGADAVWGCPGVDCPTNSLNGFSLADDVPDDFHQRLYNGETGSDLLNEGLVPPPDGYRIKCINSAFAQYITPREVSQDHVAGLFIGFALVKKFIPETLNSNTHFTDFYPEFNYVKEVQNIANRFIDWMESSFPHKWQLRNLCENRCVRGSCNPSKAYCGNNFVANLLPCPYLLDACGIGAVTGANAKPGAIGFIAANEFIQGLPSTALEGLIGNTIYRDEWDFGINSPIFSPSPWKYTLVAIGGVGRFTEVIPWPFQVIIADSKKNIAKFLVKDGVKKHWEHLILLNRLFYGTQHKNNGDEITIPNNYYECLLDAAPCRGHDGTETVVNEEWGWTDRLGGERSDGLPNSDANSRVDFMFYFNLYNEINSGYLGNQYISIPIKDLALENIDKNNYTEYDKKNFMAANNVTAHTSYVISTDAASGDRGRVIFVSGKSIDLLPGFDVGNGATLDAYNDPTIGQMTCIDPVFTDCNFLEENLKFISDSTDPETFDTLHISFQDTTLLRVINQTTGQQQNTNALNNYISPNPTSGSFTISLKESTQGEVFIYNSLGQVVFQSAINNPQFAIDLSNRPRGIYFLKVQSADGKIYTQKIILSAE